MQGSKILIVDDEQTLVNMLKRILNKMDFQVAVANNGLQAVEQASQFDPDIILLDIKMPQMDGIQVLKKLRGMPRFAETPIVVLSAKGQPHEINAGLEAGADSYLCKPVMFEEIFKTIQGYLQR